MLNCVSHQFYSDGHIGIEFQLLINWGRKERINIKYNLRCVELGSAMNLLIEFVAICSVTAIFFVAQKSFGMFICSICFIWSIWLHFRPWLQWLKQPVKGKKTTENSFQVIILNSKQGAYHEISGFTYFIESNKSALSDMNVTVRNHFDLEMDRKNANSPFVIITCKT